MFHRTACYRIYRMQHNSANIVYKEVSADQSNVFRNRNRYPEILSFVAKRHKFLTLIKNLLSCRFDIKVSRSWVSVVRNFVFIFSVLPRNMSVELRYILSINIITFIVYFILDVVTIWSLKIACMVFCRLCCRYACLKFEVGRYFQW